MRSVRLFISVIKIASSKQYSKETNIVNDIINITLSAFLLLENFINSVNKFNPLKP